MDIECIEPVDNRVLTDFLSGRDDTALFHKPAWHQFIQQTYGHRCAYWAARSDGRIVGVFPLISVTQPLLGNKLIGIPYQMYSGVPVADQDGIRIQLVEHAIAAARESRGNYFEVRHFGPAPFLEDLGFVSMDSQVVTSTVALDGLDLQNLRRTRRQEIAYATRRGVRVEVSSALADLRRFRRLYLEEGRALDSPRAGWDYFENMFRLLPEACRFLVAIAKDGRCLGGYLTLIDGRHAFARYAAYGSPEDNRLRLSKALTWHAMRDAADQGCKEFNMGIIWSQDAGLIKLKESWWAESRPVYQFVLPLRGKAPNLGDYFGGFSFAKMVWRRLPMPVVDWVGSRVTGWIC